MKQNRPPLFKAKRKVSVLLMEKDSEPETFEETSEDEDEHANDTGRLQFKTISKKVYKTHSHVIHAQVIITKRNTARQLKVGDIIRYKDSPNDVIQISTIVSRAGKASGKYSNWYNI